jgi:hypothetical protein
MKSLTIVNKRKINIKVKQSNILKFKKYPDEVPTTSFFFISGLGDYLEYGCADISDIHVWVDTTGTKPDYASIKDETEDELKWLKDNGYILTLRFVARNQDVIRSEFMWIELNEMIGMWNWNFPEHEFDLH